MCIPGWLSCVNRWGFLDIEGKEVRAGREVNLDRLVQKR